VFAGVLGPLRIDHRFGVGVAAVLAAGLLAAGRMSAKVNTIPASVQAPAAPSAACAPCHQAIYERYRKTPMANASGAAADGFLPGSFTHAASGVSYKIIEKEGHVYLTFAREAAPQVHGTAEDGSLDGRRELKYFLGSGKRGRTYLFDQDGYWFEIPVNWYAKKRIWDMAPNYQNVREMPLTLPVDPGCLRCHASEAQPSLPQARNRYAGAPFLAGGITCQACHGDAKAHLASGGKIPMQNLDQLEAVRRDSICLSCHLEGQEAVVHAGKRLVDFRPGESIFDYASFFVRAAGLGERATSQWEALLQSGCKRAAGDKLTCTTCHDPHGSTEGMSVGERVAFYRARCLQCHDSGAAGSTGPVGLGGEPRGSFGATHHPENPDCASCHMPRARADDIAHEQVTDHRILRVPEEKFKSAGEAGLGSLVAVDQAEGVPGPSTDRDLGLAYALAASRGDRQAGENAMDLLRKSEALPGAAADYELHEQLGFLDQLNGDKDAAIREYGLALEANGYDSVAEGNLALLKAGNRQYGAAVELWERAFRDDPVQWKAGMNLAVVECGIGKKEAAQSTLERILAFSPDDGAAKTLAREIHSGTRGCAPH